MTETRIRELIALAEALDSRALARAFTPDGVIGFSNQAPADGHHGVEKAIAGLFELLDRIEYELLALWPVPDGWVVEAKAACFVKGAATPVVVRGVLVVRCDGDRVRDARVYFDLAPVFATAQWASMQQAAR